MSKRLQVLMEEAEFREIQRIARRKRMTMAEWVRQVLREARRQEPTKDMERKLSAIREAVQHRFPAPDIDQMNEEIERGYLSGEWPRE